ncbi:MAG: hypothetical protein Kow0022_08840 [Phycisphaerales bacterium]
MPMHRLAPNTGSTFSQRLGYYMLGIAIGLMLLGWFQMQRRIAVQQQANDQAARQQPGEPIVSPPRP